MDNLLPMPGPMPTLFKRREVLLPTLWGWLLLLGAAGLLLALLARFANDLLAPVDPRPAARVLVIEGWVSELDLDKALLMLRVGRYERVYVAGGPITSWSSHRSYAERAHAYLAPRMPNGLALHAAPAPYTAQDRTFHSAMVVRELAAAQGQPIPELDVLTSGVHGRRTRWLYQAAFGEQVPVGVVSLKPEYDAVHWWRSSMAFKAVLGEALSLAWVACCFRAPPRGSHEERWGMPAPAASIATP